MAIYDKQAAREHFRQSVLEAMDKSARVIFGRAIDRNDCGATDDDLPRLFRAIDKQLDMLYSRFDAPSDE